MAAKKIGAKGKKKVKNSGPMKLSGSQFFKRSNFSRGRLAVFVMIFAVIGGVIILKSFAAGNSKIWDTQTDFNSGTLSNTVTTSAGHVTLTPNTSGSGGTSTSARSLPTYNYIAQPYTTEASDLSTCYQYEWLYGGSPTTPYVSPDSLHTSNQRYLLVNPNYNDGYGHQGKDDWWFVTEYWLDSTTPSNFQGQYDSFFNLHNTAGDAGPSGGIGWSFGSGVSAFHLMYRTDGTPLMHLENVVSGGQDYLFPTQAKNAWHQYVMHITFGRADGTTPHAGAVQIWVDGTKRYDLTNLNLLQKAVGPDGVTYVQRWVTLWQGTYTKSAPCNPNNTSARSGRAVLARIGNSLQQALDDTPKLDSAGGSIHNPGQPNFGDSSYSIASTQRTTTDFVLPSDLGGGGTANYPSSGTITLPFDAGGTASWDGVTPVQTTPDGTSISYQYRSSTDNTNWSAWTSILSSVPQGRYFQLKAALSTTNSSATPDIDKITLNYTPQGSGTGAVTVSQSVSDNQTIKGTFTWTATTSDDSQVKSISFYVDNTLRNTETGAPWGSGDPPNTDAGQVDSTQYADGAHTLKAVATLTDSTTVSTSASVTIQNGTAPSPPAFVSSSVTNGQTLSGTVNWDIATSGSVSGVEYWADGTKLYTDTSAPYSYAWDTTKVANGSHQINVMIDGTDGSRVSAGTGGILGTVTVNNTAVAKTGDLNGDGKVDVVDLSMLLSNFGTNNAAGDVNKDGTVNVLDLSALLTNFSP